MALAALLLIHPITAHAVPPDPEARRNMVSRQGAPGDRALPSRALAARRSRPAPPPRAGARQAPEDAAAKAASPREEARALVVQGVAELQAGDYLKALDLFQRAYTLFPSPQILFNLGQVYRELGRLVDALDAYERFLREAPKTASASLLDLARKQVVALKDRVATVLVQVEEPGATVSINGVEVAVTPMDVPHRVMPGPLAIVVRKEGFLPATDNVTTKAGERLMRPLVLRRPSKVVVQQVVYQLRQKPRKGLPVLWTGVATTAALAAALAVTGSLTLYELGVYKDTSKTVSRRLLAVERGKRFRAATDGLIIAAGATAIFTTVWGLVVVRRSGGVERIPVTAPDATGAASLRLFPAGAGVLLEGRF